MKVCFATILLICFEHVTKVIAQGLPLSPCPKIFQYRFDGSEWFGLIAVRNPDIIQPLQLRVTLSMRGKPTTHYLGEIELLTRGQFISNAPVLYKIRFPKHNFPPKLLQVSVNNQVICFGAGDHSIFMTQIQLEHIRKLTFVPDKLPSLMNEGETTKAVGKEHRPMPSPHIQFKKKPFHTPREICGHIDKSLNFQLAAFTRTSVDELQKQTVKSAGFVGGGPMDEFGAAADVSHSPVFATLSDYDSDDIDFEQEHGEHKEVEELGEEEDGADTTTLFAAGQNASRPSAVIGPPSIARGAWPWLAAIYVNNLTSLEYQCGGTLASARVVISSAHCLQLLNQQRYTANEVLVFLGRHNLKNWNEEGSLAAPVDGIYIHPDYNGQLSNYDADIAVLVLTNEVRFNAFIRPACLWSGSSRTEYIVGEHGIVIGWSFNRANTTATVSTIAKGTAATSSPASASIPKLVYAPIISNEACFKANAHFRSLSSNRTFCAGIRLQPQPSAAPASSCRFQSEHMARYTGLSGAGLMIHRNNRWMLRGTVSAALPAARCTADRYIIYADVAKFIDWLMAFII